MVVRFVHDPFTHDPSPPPVPGKLASIGLPGAQILIRRRQLRSEPLGSAPGEVRVAEQLSGEQDDIRLTGGDDRIRLLRLGDQPDRPVAMPDSRRIRSANGPC